MHMRDKGDALAGHHAVVPTPQERALGKQLLYYRPDGPLGGTFSCVSCAAQGWQPELIEHRPGCPFCLPAPAPTS